MDLSHCDIEIRFVAFSTDRLLEVSLGIFQATFTDGNAGLEIVIVRIACMILFYSRL